MVKFKQLIRPGQRGRDVRAVKRTMLRMGVSSSGALGKTNKAGPAFVKCIKTVQKHHGLRVDGIYGKDTHKIIAPHFRAYDRFLYRTAKRRGTHTVNVTSLSAQAAAKKLLQYHADGKYRADNGMDLLDLQRTAQGNPVWSQAGYWVHIDKRVLEALVFLIEKGYKIGTFAICSAHHYDGPHGHSGGHAVDISSINGISVASGSAGHITLEVAKLIHSGMPAGLHPWQEICDGFAYQHDPSIAACTIPSSGYYGYTTMSEHRNHIHLGYYGS